MKLMNKRLHIKGWSIFAIVLLAVMSLHCPKRSRFEFGRYASLRRGILEVIRNIEDGEKSYSLDMDLNLYQMQLGRKGEVYSLVTSDKCYRIITFKDRHILITTIVSLLSEKPKKSPGRLLIVGRYSDDDETYLLGFESRETIPVSREVYDALRIDVGNRYDLLCTFSKQKCRYELIGKFPSVPQFLMGIGGDSYWMKTYDCEKDNASSYYNTNALFYSSLHKAGRFVSCENFNFFAPADPRRRTGCGKSTNDFPKIQNELLMRKKQLQQHNDRIVSSVKIWFESPNPTNVPCVDVPCLFRVYPCQEHLLASSNDNFMVQADLVFRIRNDSTYWFRFGKELQMCGYYNLEIDMRLSDGNIFHLKRKDGIWYRNFIEEESIRGEKEYRCLVSLDRRLWNGMPPSFINKVVEVRPRFAFFCFEKDGRRYKSIDDMKSNVETRTWNHSRIGELIGDWCKTPVSPHMSAQ